MALDFSCLAPGIAVERRIGPLEKYADHHLQNFNGLARVPWTIFKANIGRYALPREGEIAAYFETNREALIEGQRRYPDGRVSGRRTAAG